MRSPFRSHFTSLSQETEKRPNGLPMPSETDENGELYFYFGWENINGGWLVRRQLRSNGDTVDAIPSNNSSHADLTGAWLARETLTYDV